MVGGGAGSGRVRAAFSTPPALSASTNYKACILQPVSVMEGSWYAGTSHYWNTGSGSGGITNGPLSAPNNSGGDGGQDTFNSGATLTYPASSFAAGNYSVDPEITVASPAPPAGPVQVAFMSTM